ncbi:MAG: Gfo/Idh/MocA family oxidoreductase [Proteobacteria bacterium]|nr:Gfo/Idh/MocA family oxidoreductase [Pseudomonadota bacterium]
MRVVVAGLGVQGRKRRAIAGVECVATVDPVNPDADYRALEDVPARSYDAVLACVPDAPKTALIEACIEHGKHVLVEKPLWAGDETTLERLETLARAAGVVVYTAYNHRFEPHFEAMRALIASGKLGRLYHCRMFYGNGTARLVRDSAWRDQGDGVLPDLGSHLLDTARFWFNALYEDIRVISADRFENQAPDHVVLASTLAEPRLELEMSLVSWRNHFTCDLFGENGSAHIDSLCKWGPSTFTVRDRVLPSGRPPENSLTLVQADPTWALEYVHFKALCANQTPADLSGDRWLVRTLSRLGNEVASA